LFLTIGPLPARILVSPDSHGMFLYCFVHDLHSLTMPSSKIRSRWNVTWSFQRVFSNEGLSSLRNLICVSIKRRVEIHGKTGILLKKRLGIHFAVIPSAMGVKEYEQVFQLVL